MEDKYYTRSTGEKVKISEMETTHLINSLSKSYREIFNSTDDKDYGKRLESINDLKEEVHKRMNIFFDNLGKNKDE